MSNDKIGVNSNQDAQVDERIESYQMFANMAQQTSAYRKTWVDYQASTVQEDVSFPIFGMIDTLVTDLGDFFSESQSSKIKSGPIVAPNSDMLAYYSRMRDHAFFNYLYTLQPENIDGTSYEAQIFASDETPLTSTDTFSKPYRQVYREQLRKLAGIEDKLTNTFKMQRTWMDYILETAIPTFLLKLIAYENFQAFMYRQANELTEEYADITASLESIRLKFDERWEREYQVPAPSLEKLAFTPNVNLVYQHVSALQNEHLFDVYCHYQEHTTVGTLIAFYRLACQVHHQTSKNEDPSDVEDSLNRLNAIIMHMESIHPNMRSILTHEKATVAQEMDLAERMSNHSVNSEEKTRFLTGLAEKYQIFIQNRTLDNLRAVHSHIRNNTKYRHNSFVKQTRLLLATLYPEAEQILHQQHIAHINDNARECFLKKYGTTNFAHPIYKRIMEFINDPTWSNLHQVEDTMSANHDDVHYQDELFSALIDDFMQLCSTENNSLDDDSSEQSSSTTEKSPRHLSIASPDDTALTLNENPERNKMVSDLTSNPFNSEYKTPVNQYGFFAESPITQNYAETDPLLEQEPTCIEIVAEYCDSYTRLYEELEQTLLDIEVLHSGKARQHDVLSRLLLAMSYMVYPVVALACLCLPSSREVHLQQLSEKRNRLKDEMYYTQQKIKAVWDDQNPQNSVHHNANSPC